MNPITNMRQITERDLRMRACLIDEYCVGYPDRKTVERGILSTVIVNFNATAGFGMLQRGTAYTNGHYEEIPSSKRHYLCKMFNGWFLGGGFKDAGNWASTNCQEAGV